MKSPQLSDLPAAKDSKSGWPWTEESDANAWLKKREAWPRVSIVIPSYNQKDYVEESIRSVLLQGYPDLEFFVYDAGSTDGSVEIIRKYEPWLTYWASEPDKGQSDAINKGLRRATGKYFNWQNSDDILAPCSLFMAVNALLQHPEASHVHGYEHIVYGNGKLHSSTEKAYGPPTRLAPDVCGSISRLKTGTQPGCLMDRELVASVGGIDESMHFVMDVDILLKLSVIKPPLYLHEKLVNYRYHPGTKSHNVWSQERGMERLKMVQNLFKMPEAQKYIALRRQANSTAHRYAADCSWMSRDIRGFIFHIIMDIVLTPWCGWAQRRALFYNQREREKNSRIMREMNSQTEL